MAVVSKLRAHENKTVSHQASLTEQRLTAQSWRPVVLSLLGHPDHLPPLRHRRHSPRPASNAPSSRANVSCPVWRQPDMSHLRLPASPHPSCLPACHLVHYKMGTKKNQFSKAKNIIVIIIIIVVVMIIEYSMYQAAQACFPDDCGTRKPPF